MKNALHNPHDRLFRRSMQYPQVSREFLEAHLPVEIKNQLDLTSVSVCPNSFIDDELKLLQSDVLFKSKIQDEDAYVYILSEHQSQSDKLMPFRLIHYMTKIWDYHIKEKKGKNPLPLPVIIPLVFYTGKGKYKANSTLWDLCGSQSCLMHSILSKPFPVIEVNTLSKSELLSRKWSGTLEYIMSPYFRAHLKEGIILISENLNQLWLEKDKPLVVELLTYIVHINKEHRSYKELIETIEGHLPQHVEHEMMTLADYLREEGEHIGFKKGEHVGFEKGRHKEKISTAKKMLLAGSAPAFVIKVTGLSGSQVEALQKEVEKDESSFAASSHLCDNFPL